MGFLLSVFGAAYVSVFASNYEDEPGTRATLLVILLGVSPTRCCKPLLEHLEGLLWVILFK